MPAEAPQFRLATWSKASQPDAKSQRSARESRRKNGESDLGTYKNALAKRPNLTFDGEVNRIIVGGCNEFTADHLYPASENFPDPRRDYFGAASSLSRRIPWSFHEKTKVTATDSDQFLPGDGIGRPSRPRSS